MKRAKRAGGWGLYFVKLIAIGYAAIAKQALAQDSGANPAVVVTLRCEPPSVRVGETAVLRAFAQVESSLRSQADRIFTWHVDLLSLEPDLVRWEPGTLKKPAADADPALSSSGVADGPHLRGIRDSYLDVEGAGVAQSVELFSIEVRAQAVGTALFRLRAPVSVDGADPDFLVLPTDARDAWVGGDYAAAVASLTIRGVGGGPPTLRIRAMDGGRIRVEAEVEAGGTVGLEETAVLGAGARWVPVGPTSPPSATVALETSADGSTRFFRAVRLP